MTSTQPVCIEDKAFDASSLMRKFPPKFTNGHKRAVFDAVGGVDACAESSLLYSRWKAGQLPATWEPSTRPCESVGRSGVFEYDHDPTETHKTHWYLNFADPELFGYYGGGLLAQDELQVFEHPILGSLRQAILDASGTARTVEADEPTPVLVEDAERRIAFDTMPKAADGRPEGLYGNRFSAADRDTVLAAYTQPDPPTFSNILAIAAPPGGRGTYSESDIRFILTTAYCGFAAATLRSRGDRANQNVVIHTGFWGCGAFGGNRVLTPALQLIAADLAGVNRMIFYAFDEAGAAQFEDAKTLRKQFASSGPVPMEELIRSLAEKAFPWGIGDGN